MTDQKELNQPQSPSAGGNQAVPPPPMKKTSFVPFLIAGVVVVLILAIGGYYFYTKQNTSNGQVIKNQTSAPSLTLEAEQPSPTAPTTSDVSTWKTYNNKELAFSIQYPDNFNLETNEDCIYLRKDQAWIGISLSNIACFVTGLGVVNKEEVLSSYQLTIGDKSYQLKDVRLVVGSDDHVWGVLTNDELSWLTIKSPSGQEIGLFFLMPFNLYSSNQEVFHRVLSTFKFTQ